MRLWKIPDQVIRLAVLLAAALAVSVVVRARFTPPSFGELGHFRADAIPVALEQPIRYGGSRLCLECHDGEGELLGGSYHRMLSCEVCHGPAAAHAEDFEAHSPVIPRQRGAACLYCHSYLPSRPTGFPQIIERLHNPLEACVACHDPHDPTPPQVPETCSACHAHIARTKAVSHHLTVECVTCHETAAEHLEKPRSFLPRKPAERAFCGQCHAEGATASAQIPRVEFATHGERYLCWRCHYPHFPEG